jgi:hypothetical protein
MMLFLPLPWHGNHDLLQEASISSTTYVPDCLMGIQFETTNSLG